MIPAHWTEWQAAGYSLAWFALGMAAGAWAVVQARRDRIRRFWRARK